MTLLNFIESLNLPSTVFVQVRNLFQGVLTGSLNPAVAFIAYPVPDDLEQNLKEVKRDVLNSVLDSDASGPELTLTKIVRVMGLKKEAEILWAIESVLRAGKNNFFESIVSPIRPADLALFFWRFVQQGSKALKLPGVQGQVVNVRLNDLFIAWRAEKQASLPPPEPPPGPPHEIHGPYSGPG